MTVSTHKFQDGHFHHALVEVRWLVLHDLDSDNFVRLHILTLHDLAECALTEDVQDQVPASQSARFLRR